MAKLEIQIQTRKMLKPSTPTPNHLQSLKLSLFDQTAPPLYVPILFHYLSTSEGIIEICDKLQKTLAETLTKFYPLAGRFRKDDLSIYCNDKGVEYVETKVNVDLAEFLNEGPKIELLNNLLPWCVPPDSDQPSSPLLGVQVNIFNCGGLVIGIQISHVLTDAFTLATFVNEWAHISQTGTTKANYLPSFSHLPSLFPTRVPSGPQFSPTSDRGAKIVTRRFMFDALTIEKLKSNSSATSRKPTRAVVIMSLIWKVLVGISSAKHGHSRESSLCFTVGLRGKSNIPSSKHALGNFGMFGIANLEANQPREELNDFINLVGNTIRDASIGIGKASVDEISPMYVDTYTKVVDMLLKGDEMDIYLSTSWCRFPWYEADFGWGKPFWVSSVSHAVEVICLIDTKDGDGIEAWVSLTENDMAEFERDPHILTFCPPLGK
ncbi:acetyl-CoA-benzylalcohol acetyltransferase-like [Lycium ferocissimum]|uniref:acetyl-CoA-benzylalcohol acetyltransferase-like n=1 Tax=Lycium ferocissimum TaxID=112874 RepID=UPI00281606F4|nr:acetyl-CoA-benzylalcohol acetyltransferase-like [Lycium ferocissimum]